MTTMTHDTSISWTECPVCSELHRAYEQTVAATEKAWTSYSFFEATYREALDAGMVGFGTTAWREWHDLLDQLMHAYYDATAAQSDRLEAWAESIGEHTEPQTAAPAEAPARTEEKTTISMADVAAEQEALEELWYGDVPDFELPDDIMDGSWALLHAASVDQRLHAPAGAVRPSHGQGIPGMGREPSARHPRRDRHPARRRRPRKPAMRAVCMTITLLRTVGNVIVVLFGDALCDLCADLGRRIREWRTRRRSARRWRARPR